MLEKSLKIKKIYLKNNYFQSFFSIPYNSFNINFSNFSNINFLCDYNVVKIFAQFFKYFKVKFYRETSEGLWNTSLRKPPYIFEQLSITSVVKLFKKVWFSGNLAGAFSY